MDQSLYVTSIKNEPTELISSDQLEIPPELQLKIVKKENDYLIRSEVYIKMEPQEDEEKFPIIEGISYEMCPKDNITDEPTVKIEREDLRDNLMQYPLDTSNELKVAEQFPIGLDKSKSRIKTEQNDDEKDKNLLKTNKDSPHGSGSNQVQDQLLIRNDLDQACPTSLHFNQFLIRNTLCVQPTGRTLDKPDFDQNKDKKNVCNECNKTFTRKSDLNRHLRIHTGRTKYYSCTMCNSTFRYKMLLNLHSRIHFGEKPFHCNICKESFTQKRILDEHMVKHNINIIYARTHICDVCKKGFRYKSYLNEHKLIHSDKKPFSCNVCNKSFTQKRILSVHEQTHSGEKPYACDLCHKAFTRKTRLTQHKRLHAGEVPYSCDTCNKSFATKSNLNTHKKNHKC